MTPFYSPDDVPEIAADLHRRPYTYEPAPAWRFDWRTFARSVLTMSLGMTAAILVGVYGYAMLLGVIAVMWLAGPFYIAGTEGTSYRPAWLILGMSAFGAGLVLLAIAGGAL